MKRFIIILIVLVLTAILGYIAWRYFQPTVVTSPPEPTPLVRGGLGESIVQLSPRSIFDYWIREGGEIHYIAPTGQIYKLDDQGNEAELTSQTIPDLDSVRASPDGAAIVVSFGAGSNKTFSLFRVTDAAWQPLPEGVTAVTWDPEGPRLAYLRDAGSVSILNLLNLANNRTTEIIRLAQKDLGLDWSAPDEIYLTQRPSFRFAGSLWAFNLRTKTLRTIIREESGLMVRWSANGQLGLKSTNSGRDIRLSLVNNNNQPLRPVRLPPTLPLKCVFEEELVYCAVPAGIPSAAFLPDDYLKNKIYFNDAFYSWDTATGTVQVIPVNHQAPLDAERLTKYEQRIFFINRYDRKLYSLEIPN